MKIDISQSPSVLDALNAVLNKGSVAELKIEHGRIVVIEIKRTKRHCDITRELRHRMCNCKAEGCI